MNNSRVCKLITVYIRVCTSICYYVCTVLLYRKLSYVVPKSVFYYTTVVIWVIHTVCICTQFTVQISLCCPKVGTLLYYSRVIFNYEYTITAVEH